MSLQSDLEDLEPAPQRQAPINGYAGSNSRLAQRNDAVERDQDPGLSISLDFLKNGNENGDDDVDHDVLSTRRKQAAAETRSQAAPISSLRSHTSQHSLQRGGFSPTVNPIGSPFSSSSPHHGDPSSPWREPSQAQLYRRTSQLVEESDPVVLSSSQRSNRERSMSNQSNQWPSPSIASNTIAASKGINGSSAVGSSADSPRVDHRDHYSRQSSQLPVGYSGSPGSVTSDSSFQNWPPEIRRYQHVSAALYRSSSASRAQQPGATPVNGNSSPLTTTGFVPWALNSESDSRYPTLQEHRRDGSLDSRGHGSRRGPSPSRLDTRDYSSSPRVLETMPEGVEHHAISSAESMGSIGRSHHRQRSSSSAAALGTLHDLQEGPAHGGWPQQSQETSRLGQDSDRQKSSDWSGQLSASLPQHPQRSYSGQSSGGEQWGDGGETARQSPVDRRPELGDLYERGQLPYSEATKTFGGNAQGPESRRHSFSTAAEAPFAANSFQQRRAVGFELRDHSGTRRDQRNPLDSATPTHASRGVSHSFRGGLSEDDLAADLGQLNAELDRISAEQRGYTAISKGVDYRVPSSQAAMAGAYAASMPTGVGGFSPEQWSLAAGSRNSPWNHLGTDIAAPHHHHLGSKSRSVSVGPRPSSPPFERARQRGRAESISASESSFEEHGVAEGRAASLHRADGPALGGIGTDLSHSYLQQQQQHQRLNGYASGELGGQQRQNIASAPQNGAMMTSSSIANPNTFTGRPGFDPPRPAPPDAGSVPVLNDFALHSLASLAPTANASATVGQPGAGPSSFAELGRGVPLGQLPPETRLYVVGFKQGRTDLFFQQTDRTAREDPIHRDDLVIVEADRGKDIGRVINDSLTADQVRMFLAVQAADASGLAPGAMDGVAHLSASPPRTSSNPASLGSRAASAARSINPKRLYGKASPADMSLLISKAADEERALAMCVAKVQQRGLPMQVVAAELQWDRRKLTFYYTAASRVDFRALVADLFKIWKLRVWMCHISPQPQVAMAGPPPPPLPPPPASALSARNQQQQLT